MQIVPPKRLEFILGIIDSLDPQSRPRKLDNKAAFNCVCEVIQSGSAWRYANVSGCSFSTAYKRFRKLTANDKKELKKRHVVENMFCRLKQFKRMRLRMAKWASVFEAETFTKSG